MKTKIFVEKLAKMAPDSETLLRRGLKPNYVRNLVDSYQIGLKETYVEYDDELLNLINNYDVSAVEIGSVHFDLDQSIRPLTESARFFRVGLDEADFLVIDTASGEIVVEDSHSPGFIVSYCAQSSGAFLDALYQIAMPNDEYLRNEADINSVDWCKKAADCAKLAGGDKYLTYYKATLGCES